MLYIRGLQSIKNPTSQSMGVWKSDEILPNRYIIAGSLAEIYLVFNKSDTSSYEDLRTTWTGFTNVFEVDDSSRVYISYHIPDIHELDDLWSYSKNKREMVIEESQVGNINRIREIERKIESLLEDFRELQDEVHHEISDDGCYTGTTPEEITRTTRREWVHIILVLILTLISLSLLIIL